ncbi:MAG: PH domain-containing protein [Subdoligranulum sp.]|nr:PH domain-containing protein [Subdoligranulum sp.]
MEYTVPRRGAAVVSAWFALLGALLSLPFWKNFFVSTLMTLLLWTAVCFGILAPRLSSCVLRVGGHHLTLRRGLLFPVTRRVPLRFLTGCHIVQSPLQRMTGTCVLLLYSSGVTTIAPGVRRADAEALAALLTHGGRML